MPNLVRNIDSSYALDWSKWPVPTMPDVPTEPWAGIPGSFWRDDVRYLPIDAARTASLAAYNVPVRASAGAAPYAGTSYGMPYSLVSETLLKTKVWDLARPVTWNWFTPTYPTVSVPLPDTVRLEGDPNGSSDLHYYGFDPVAQVLYEMIVVSKSSLNYLKTLGQCEWTAGYAGGASGIARWDCKKTWNTPGQPQGVVAAGIPQFPLIVRWDEIKKGRIGHAVFGVLPNYNKAKIGAARGSDGDLLDHPVRAGERLRLKRSVVEKFALGTPARIIAQAMYEFGWIQGDRNQWAAGSWTGNGNFALSQDRRWSLGEGNIPPLGTFEVSLTDFEVVQQ